MPKNVLFLIVGVILGAVVTALFTSDPGELPEVKVGDDPLVNESEMNLPSALAELKKLKAENQFLKAEQARKEKSMVTVYPKQESVQGALEGAQESAREEDREPQRSGMESRILRMMETRIQNRIARIKSAVGMSEEQAGTVEAFLRERGELQMEYRRLRFSGEITGEQEADYTAKLQEMSVGNFLKDNLTEEQYSEYDQFLQEQNQVELESYASRQLSNLVQSVRLSDEQKDQAYQAFYQEAHNSIPEGEEFSAGRRMFGPEAVDNMETQLIALEGILNEEQMSTYRTQVQTRMETFQSGGGRPRGPGGR